MSITAKWTTTCDGCGLVVEKEIILNEDTARSGGYLDIWSPGWPQDWLQIPHDEKTNDFYLFFHSSDCYKDWLRQQNRLDDIKKHEEVIWIA